MGIVLFLVSIILLVLFIYLVCPYLFQLKALERFIGAYLIGSGFIIVLYEIAGFLHFLDQPIWILLTQVILCGLAIGVRKVFQVDQAKLNIREFIKKIKNEWSNYSRFLIPVLLIIGATYLFLIFLQFRFPQTTSDSLYNHLSRIAHWLQQGSLAKYYSFSDTGTTYPYNNSILMLWSVSFLKSDRLVGLVQYFSLLILTLTIYSASLELGISKGRAILGAIFFLTFPIIIFESITAQNDILVACYLMNAFYFMVRFRYTGNRQFLIYSILGFALATGTKQTALFALPGYISLYAYSLISQKGIRLRIFRFSVIITLFFTFLVGGYAYLQNWLVLGNPVGSKILSRPSAPYNQGSFFAKANINSARLTYQFISCEGIPPHWEKRCIEVKEKLVGFAFRNKILNVELNRFLLEEETPFSFQNHYLLNEESSWFGLQGWLLLIPVVVVNLFSLVKKKNPIFLLFLFSNLVFWIATASIKAGWDLYLGRYLIFPIALLMPYTGKMFEKKRFLSQALLTALLIISLFTMVYSLLNNDSRPLISKVSMFNMEKWGMEKCKIVQKIAYKLTPLIRNENDVWGKDDITLRTHTNGIMRPVLYLVENRVPQNANLVIVNSWSYFPDYLFFGEHFTRKIFEVSKPSQIEINSESDTYLLISPEFVSDNYTGYQYFDRVGEWRLFVSKTP